MQNYKNINCYIMLMTKYTIHKNIYKLDQTICKMVYSLQKYLWCISGRAIPSIFIKCICYVKVANKIY